MDNQTIGKKITKLRAQLNLTTTELAKMVGISQAQISRLENGKQGFRSSTLAKIAQALNVEPVWFFLDNEQDSTLNDAAAAYAAIAHPRLAQALQNPQFQALADRFARLFLKDRNVAMGMVAEAEMKMSGESLVTSR
jgi:transcriptional regulator with XRE-family HTH domain